jgi:hypothetical protein
MFGIQNLTSLASSFPYDPSPRSRKQNQKTSRIPHEQHPEGPRETMVVLTAVEGERNRRTPAVCTRHGHSIHAASISSTMVYLPAAAGATPPTVLPRTGTLPQSCRSPASVQLLAPAASAVAWQPHHPVPRGKASHLIRLQGMPGVTRGRRRKCDSIGVSGDAVSPPD